MAKIKGRDTGPELLVRRLLYNAGYRYRLCDKSLPGKPDLVFRKRRKLIFVHGCFWHQHPGCRKSSLPKANGDFWRRKLELNVQRDQLIEMLLRESGWEVKVVWECSLKKPQLLEELVDFLGPL